MSVVDCVSSVRIDKALGFYVVKVTAIVANALLNFAHLAIFSLLILHEYSVCEQAEDVQQQHEKNRQVSIVYEQDVNVCHKL